MGGFSLINDLFQPKRLSFWESLNAWIFVAPWILGFLLFTGGPILASLVISFTHWDIVNPPQWAGLANYETMLGDPLFFQSLKVTTIYALVAVPLQIVVGLFIAILLNTKIRLIGLYRTLFYLPAVLPIVSVAVMWRWILSRDWGLINWFLSLFGVYGPGWLSEPEWALPALILMSLWGVGSGMLIYLAGLQGIPTDLYEAAEVDGAGRWASFVHITLPMISPVILFQLVVGLIAAFQVFAQPFIMTQGGPQNSTLFYLLHLIPQRLRVLPHGLRVGALLGALHVHRRPDRIDLSLFGRLGLLRRRNQERVIDDGCYFTSHRAQAPADQQAPDRSGQSPGACHPHRRLDHVPHALHLRRLDLAQDRPAMSTPSRPNSSPSPSPGRITPMP